MATYRSAMGKMVDMTALEAKNEKVRAVGNMNVNSRGDTIDSNGRIIKPVTEKVNERYSKTVGNRSAQVSKSGQVRPKVTKPIIEEELNSYEQELEDNLDDDLEVEEIKKKESKKSTRK